jgi:glyoxylase-like metal-dependent hydrolase (beta-lactamase superfamily II)/rhodanese-related sulfurtransferase
MSHPILKIISNEGCQSYLIGCPVTRVGIIVDPKVGREGQYRAMLDHYGLELAAVLDTHTHADHLSAATTFASAGVPLLMSQASQAKRSMRRLEHGEHLSVGELSFEVLEVPGHTPDSIALFGHGLVITGDSLFIGGLARADFNGSDPAQLYDSVQARLMTLPGDTLVMPGHGYNDILFSTIDCERRLNPCLAHTDGAAYASDLDCTAGAGNSKAVEANLVLNLQAAPDLPKSAGPAVACCASPSDDGASVDILEIAPPDAREVHGALTGPDQWIDVRDPFEYDAGHIPGTTPIPLSELGFHLDRLRGHEPLYLSCRSGVRSMTAAKTLQRLGVSTKPVNIGGGILAWQAMGNPIDGVHAT